jgi:hypothetical protein
MGVARGYVVGLAVWVLGAGCHHMPADSATGQFAAGGAGLFAAGRGGSGGAARTIHFAEVARSPDARATGPIKPRTFEEYREARPEAPPPSPAKSRKAFSASPSATALPLRFDHCGVVAAPCPFDGVVQDTCPSCTAPPPDPNAAAGAGRIVQVVNDLIQVTNRFGAVQCGGPVTLNRLLRTSDSLTDPRVQFDNINQRFSLAVTVSSVNSGDTPALWVAATQSDDPCGTWFTYRLTFHGDATPLGTFLDFPMLAQDTRSLLLSTRNCLPDKGCQKFIVFTIPKARIYAAEDVDFPYFSVDSLTAPVTHAGQPMIDSPVSFFLAAVPGMGYKLYVLVTLPTPFGPVLASGSLSSPFSKPSRGARQPGSDVKIDTSDGNITSSPYFDGTRIWFTHVVDEETFPTVRYGAINLRDATVSIAEASHSPWSDDFNPSLAVGFSPLRETVYLTWASTDAVVAKTATSAVAIAVDAAQPLKNLFGVGTVYATGGNVSGNPSDPTPVRFGDFSSVSVDPTTSDCAFATQQYFGTNGSWRTRIAPIGECGRVVIQP